MSVWVLEELAVEEVIRMWLELWLTPPILEQTKSGSKWKTQPCVSFCHCVVLLYCVLYGIFTKGS